MRFNGISDILLLDLPFSFHFPKLKVLFVHRRIVSRP